MLHGGFRIGSKTTGGDNVMDAKSLVTREEAFLTLILIVSSVLLIICT